MTHDIGSEQARRLRPPSERGVVRAKIVPPRLPHGSVSRPALLDVLRTGRGRTPDAGLRTGRLRQDDAAGRVGADRASSAGSPGCRSTPGTCEPERFWTHVAAALSGVEPGVTTATVAAMRPRPRRIGDVALPRLFDALADGADDVMLVLDDYHRAETPEISALLTEFMRYRPERVQLVVSTRSDPALGVARLRAGGDLVEVRADALRFDEVEVARFFDGIGLSGLTPSEGHQLAGAHAAAGPLRCGWRPCSCRSTGAPRSSSSSPGRAGTSSTISPRTCSTWSTRRPGTSCSGSRSWGVSTARCATRSPAPPDPARSWPTSSAPTCSSRWTARGSGTTLTSCSPRRCGSS